MWLKHLPIKNDLEEAKVEHDQLCLMIEQSKEEGFGPDDDNFRDMLKIFPKTWLLVSSTLFRIRANTRRYVWHKFLHNMTE